MQNAEQRATTQTTLHNMFLVKGGNDEMQQKKTGFPTRHTLHSSSEYYLFSSYITKCPL